MAEQKTCRQCNAQFTVEDEDLAFYKKISPTFDGKTFEIPAPNLCYRCRLQRRLSWRNERNLFLRTCDSEDIQIVAAYPQDSEYKVFSQKAWWSDNWDAMSYGADFEPNVSFFEQLSRLQKSVPRISLISQDSENSDYTNQAYKNKDCYMSFDVGWCENVLHSRTIYNSKDVVDCFNCRENSQSIYECVDCQNASSSTYCLSSSDIYDCHYSYNLKSCRDCIFSSNLNHKQYYIENTQYSKEEYEEKKRQMDFGSYESRKRHLEKFRNLLSSGIHKFAEMINCENCTGNNLVNSKNIMVSFGSNKSENGKYLFYSEGMKDSFDDNFSGGESGSELNVETIGSHVPYNCKFIFSCWTARDLIYCDFCHSCRDCFGCVGLRNKQHCILNKQYTKEEYEQKVAQIIEKMIADGEWGEYFPIRLSPFAYNYSLAQDYFPMKQEEIQNSGYKWLEKHDSLVPFGSYNLPDNISAVDEQILNEVLVCESSSRPFKIQPSELAFYIKQNIPIPRKHPDERYKDRFAFLTPFQLYHRKCMNEGCNNEFETTYAPDRPEKVYCESCYQKSVL